VPKALRVRLAPTPPPVTIEGENDRFNSVTGVSIILETLGEGSTSAAAAPQPATIALKLATLKRVRSEAPTFKPFAKLEGQIELRGKERKPVFIVNRGADGEPAGFTYTDPALNVDTGTPQDEAGPEGEAQEEVAGAAARRPRALELTLSRSSFEGVSPTGGRLARLLLPDEVNDAHFVEIGAELLVSGQSEGAFEANDVLDVRITDETPAAAPHYELQLVDEVGEPISGVFLRLLDGQHEATLTTDADGRAFRLARGSTSARVELADPTALKSLLKTRWAQARGKPRFKPGPDTITITPRDFGAAIALTTDAPALICIRPHVVLARLQGMFFDTNKSFLLPSALGQIAELKELYEQNPSSDLLIVGHTDTTADANTNDPLSLERADSMLAYLKDDRETWVRRYATSIPENRRWGAIEDLLMLRATPGFIAGASDKEDIEAFQSAQGLKVDGIVGAETRGRLIELYMARDGTKLPVGIKPTTHGCGENFPLDSSQEELDAVPVDDAQDLGDRRVELFFFDSELGIQPAPPGSNSKPGSTAYPEWRRRSDEIRVLQLSSRTVQLFLFDARYQRMPDTPFELIAGNVVRKGRSGSDGSLTVFEVPVTERCELRWGELASVFEPRNLTDPLSDHKNLQSDFLYSNSLDLRFQEDVANDLRLRKEARRRLDNLGYREDRFNAEYRVNRERYQLSPTDAAFDRPGFSQLADIHRQGTEAPLPPEQPFGPDTDPEFFELDGDENLELVLVADDGRPLANRTVLVSNDIGVVRSGVTNASGLVSLRGLDSGGDFTVTFPELDEEAFQVVDEDIV
jgi:outer membrane protein OmpA-like peptidoglycan-associated protein